ncbi:hypothetical protein BJY04DRAFT_70369 [Aspergillus karnatakaensis]|uniref:uncharacterized protein n=1 Tax=Aspergillus karnatakaensis TaxID=1810916 RepID=UPI003CCD0041
MVSSDEDCGETPPHLSNFSISVRSSRRRSRLSRPPTLPVTCEESAHYPVFNPHDPRHNPSLRRSACLEESGSLPAASHSTGSMRWVQSIPGRSLRRARSGLQALRSGLHRRATQSADGDHAANGLWLSSDSAEGSSDPNERLFSSTVSEASTEEDYDFGTDLYRTGCNYTGKKSKFRKAITSTSSIPASSMESDRTPVSPVETIPDLSDRNVPRICTARNSDVFHDIPAAKLDDQWVLIPSNGPDRNGTDESLQSPLQELMTSGPSLTGTAAFLAETGSDAPADDLQVSHGTAEEINAGCVSHRSSGTSHQSRVGRVPCGVIEVTERTDTYATGTSGLESRRTINDEVAIQLPDEKTAPPTTGVDNDMQAVSAVTEDHSNDAPPTVELGNLGGMEYYLTLDTLAGNDSQDSKTSSEEPSPNSLDEDRDAPLSPWLPTDKPERMSPLSLRDEYFLVDGKSTDLRPDRGDNPIKGERAFTGDGGLHSGPGLDRNLSVRTQEIPEIIGPGGPLGLPSPLPFRRDREGSDSTEEYLVTYSLFQRHYFS